jgi:cytochrome c biogenesis protein CcmG, thiol:disulfide interchange protein DsbE
MADNAEANSGAPSRRRAVIIAAIPLVIFLALAGIFLKQLLWGGNTQDIPSALIGKSIPQFALAPLEGLSGPAGQLPGLDSAALKGKVSIVNVWASWCAPCRQEHPMLMELAKGDGYQLTGINYKDKPENAVRFLGQLGNPFAAIGVDPRGSAAIDWGVYGVPETFIVGTDGTILYKHVGPLTPQSLKDSFEPALQSALAKAKSG